MVFTVIIGIYYHASISTERLYMFYGNLSLVKMGKIIIEPETKDPRVQPWEIEAYGKISFRDFLTTKEHPELIPEDDHSYYENLYEEYLRTQIVLDGQTFEEFARELFECEYCLECGGDVEDHEPWIVNGHWFAHCKGSDKEIKERLSKLGVEL